MKSTIIFDEFNEVDLKPHDLLRRYVKLAEEDVGDFLIRGHSLKACPCPACGNQKTAPAFTRFGLEYVECAGCNTLYISPRPNDEELNHYYKRSRAMTFWRDELSMATTKKRKEKIIKPRFEWLLESAREHLPEAKWLADINTNQYGYIEEMRQTQLFQRRILIDPFLKLDTANLDRGAEVVDIPWWKSSLGKESLDIITLFEVIDRTADIDLLFERVSGMLKINGLLFMTTILISGFDVQILWEKSEGVFPPERLNLFSPEGLKLLFSRHGFECLEFSTPGVLDVEIVGKAIQQNPNIKVPRFIEYMLRNRGEDARLYFQRFLQANLLSSYGRILVRKK